MPNTEIERRKSQRELSSVLKRELAKLEDEDDTDAG